MHFAGVLVAIVTPFHDDLSLDLETFAAHCEWLVDNGADGVVTCGSLGEYQLLTHEERCLLHRAAVQAVGARGTVIAGVSGSWSAACRRLADDAAEHGAHGVMTLPPTGMRPTTDEVEHHVRIIAEAGLPVMLYNNPSDTRVDLTPDILARLAEIPGVTGVKDFSGEVARVNEIKEKAPTLEVLCGADNVLVESVSMGATGWVAGFTNALPAETVEVFRLARKGDVEAALARYRPMLPLLRWDITGQFVQAIKDATSARWRNVGGVRPPRLPLPTQDKARLLADLASAVPAA